MANLNFEQPSSVDEIVETVALVQTPGIRVQGKWHSATFEFEAMCERLAEARHERYLRDRVWEPEPTACSHCGETFTPQIAADRAAFCTNACRQAAYRTRTAKASKKKRAKTK